MNACASVSMILSLRGMLRLQTVTAGKGISLVLWCSFVVTDGFAASLPYLSMHSETNKPVPAISKIAHNIRRIKMNGPATKWRPCKLVYVANSLSSPRSFTSLVSVLSAFFSSGLITTSVVIFFRLWTNLCPSFVAVSYEVFWQEACKIWQFFIHDRLIACTRFIRTQVWVFLIWRFIINI